MKRAHVEHNTKFFRSVKNGWVLLLSLLVLLFILMLKGCVSLWPTSNKETGEGERQGIENTQEEAVSAASGLGNMHLGFALADMQSLATAEGPLWQNLLLPSQELPVYPKDVFIGFKWANSNKLVAPALPGECSLFTSFETNNRHAKGKELNNQTASKIRNTEVSGLAPFDIVFFLQAREGSIVGIGTADKTGSLSCLLPHGDFVLSSGSGKLRTNTEFTHSGSGSKVSITKEKVGTAVFSQVRDAAFPDKGSLLRIGRFSSNTVLTTVANKLTRDLFQKLNFPSENMQANEALRTTLLLQNASISMQLEPGSYIALFFSPQKNDLCLQNFLVSASATTQVKCTAPWKVGNANLPKGESNTPELSIFTDQVEHGKELVFDASFLPPGLMQAPRMQRWLIGAGFTDYLYREAGKTSETELGFAELSFAKLSSALQQNPLQGLKEKLPTYAGPYLANFNYAGAGDQWLRAQFVRFINANNAFEAPRQIAEFYSYTDQSVLPIIGAGEETPLLGATPFLLRNKMNASSKGFFAPESSELLSTNGAEIRWLDPSPVANGSLLSLPLQQRFKILVRAPTYYQLNYAEIYVNSKLFGRWHIPQDTTISDVNEGSFRAQKLNERDFLLEVKIDRPEDFYLAVAAWGKDFLPELLTGGATMPGFALTRSYCVDANENGVCEATK